MESKLEHIYQSCTNSVGPISKETLQEAMETYQIMNKMSEKPYLLHGDLHHYNMLMDNSLSWVAIDPKGLIGDREYDVIQFLLNKLPNENLTEVIEKSIDIFVAELGLDKQKMLRWGFSHTVLATCWTVEEDGSYHKTFFEAISAFKQLYNFYCC
ncbi:Aminoglycoside/hydroxyurea antibiotic resistance kinase [compost metagenome]